MSRQALIAQVGHGEELEEEAVDVLVHTAGIPYSCVALKRGPEEDEDWFCLECRTAGKGPPNTPGERCPLGAFLPQAGQRGGRAALWGGLRRQDGARVLVDEEPGSDYDTEHDQGHLDGRGLRCEPAPAEPHPL